MADMGFKVCLFSISWSRIFPNEDEDSPNEERLLFYEKIVDKYMKYNIEPLITINHFDVNLYLIEKYGSYKND